VLGDDANVTVHDRVTAARRVLEAPAASNYSGDHTPACFRIRSLSVAKVFP
jgi:hypothetical protein